MSVIWHACWQIFHLHQLENKRGQLRHVSTLHLWVISLSLLNEAIVFEYWENILSVFVLLTVWIRRASFQSSSASTLLPSAALTNQPNNTWIQVDLNATMMPLYTDQRNHVYIYVAVYITEEFYHKVPSKCRKAGQGVKCLWAQHWRGNGKWITVGLRLSWSTRSVPGQPKLPLSQKQKEKQRTIEECR